MKIDEMQMPSKQESMGRTYATPSIKADGGDASQLCKCLQECGLSAFKPSPSPVTAVQRGAVCGNACSSLLLLAPLGASFSY